MKTYFLGLLFFYTISNSCFCAIKDPVAGYLSLRNRPEFISYRGDQRFYADDRVYRIDVDINNDGENEVLVSSSLDRDGKQGNVFYVFKKGIDGYNGIGTIHLNPYRFYLGKISEINGYGIVTSWPSGGGEGGYSAYVLDGDSIVEKPIGAVKYNRKTSKLEGVEFQKKYGAPGSSIITNALTIVDAHQLAKDYGVKVESKTYWKALEEYMARPTPKEE